MVECIDIFFDRKICKVYYLFSLKQCQINNISILGLNDFYFNFINIFNLYVDIFLYFKLF